MIPKLPVGNTGISVSAIGLGTVKFGRNQQVKYPQSFELPSDNEIKNILTYASDLGINLLDTAPAYGTSEKRLGKILKSSRHDWILSTKVGEEFLNGESSYDFSHEHVKKSIERSLTRLNTDYLDIVLVHSNGDDEKIISSGIFSTLSEIKTNGLIRAFGMSTKTIAGGKLAVDQSDIVMVTYNPLEQAEKEIIDYACKKNKGVFIKKGLVSGHVDKISAVDPVQTTMDFIFAAKGVSSVIVGTLNVEHLRHDVECAEKALLHS